MPNSTQIAAQMFTLRDHCETPADIAKTLGRLKDMGFNACQPSAAGFKDIDPKELKKILDDHGMACAATHRQLEQLSDTAAAIDYHKTLDCELTAIGGFGFGGKSRDEWLAFIDEYSKIADELAAGGLKLGYHNHSHEWAPLGDPAPDVDTPIGLMRERMAQSVWLEIDTYWVAHGGGDPAAWIEAFSGRVPAIHVKDLTITAHREHKMCEVGSGNLNWPRILDAAKQAGVRWYIIERDSGDLDPFESLKISLDNLHTMGLA